MALPVLTAVRSAGETETETNQLCLLLLWILHEHYVNARCEQVIEAIGTVETVMV